MTNILTVRDLVKTFGGDTKSRTASAAVDSVSFDVPAGALFTILGPSGCGKTTILRCIAGLERPDTGEIELDGRVLSSPARGLHVAPAGRGLGMVFQSYAIWPHLSVFDNAAFPLSVVPRRRRLSRGEIRARVERVLSAVRLDALAGRSATELSGGEQQRLALARALVMEPPLLLLDEPLSNLDARLREEMRFELQRLQRELGVTTIYVTHDQMEALSLSSRVAVMNSGRLEQVGSPRDVYERPASRFVADFIGAPNLIEGVVAAANDYGESLVETPAGPVSAPRRNGYGAGARVLVVVRPQHISLALREPGANGGGWRGTVASLAYLGDGVDHLIRVGPMQIRARTTADRVFAPGSEVTLKFQSDACAVLPLDPRQS